MPITTFGPLTCCTNPVSEEKTIVCCSGCGTPAKLKRRIKRVGTESCMAFKQLHDGLSSDLTDEQNEENNAYYDLHYIRYSTIHSYEERYGPSRGECGPYHLDDVYYVGCWQNPTDDRPQGHGGCCSNKEQTVVRSRDLNNAVFGNAGGCVRTTTHLVRNDDRDAGCTECRHVSGTYPDFSYSERTYSGQVTAGGELEEAPFGDEWSDDSFNFLPEHRGGGGTLQYKPYIASTLSQNHYAGDYDIRKQKAYCCIVIGDRFNALVANARYTWEIQVAEYTYVTRMVTDFRGNEVSSNFWSYQNEDGTITSDLTIISGTFDTDENGYVDDEGTFQHGKAYFNGDPVQLPDPESDEDDSFNNSIWHELPYALGKAYSTISQTYQYEQL